MKKRLNELTKNSKKKYYSLSKFEKMMFLFGAIFILVILATVFISGVMNAYPYTPAGGATINNDVWQIVDGVVKLINPSNVSVDGDLNVTKNLNVVGNIDVEGDLEVLGNITGENMNISGQVSINGASRMRATRNTTQTTLAGNSVSVQYNNITFDNLGEYNTSNYRFTASEAGYYEVKASLLFDNIVWAVEDVASLGLYKNGELYSYLERIESQEGVVYQYVRLAGTDIIYLNANEFISIVVNQNRGSTDIYPDERFNYFSVHRLS